MRAATTPAILEIERVSVRYGRVLAVDDLSLRLDPGTVFALLGRNGAGKSSLFRCLAGQHRADAGTIRIAGHDAWRERAVAMKRVGVVPEDPDAPPSLTVARVVDYCAAVDPDWNRAAVRERLGRHHLPLDRRFGELSKGQKKLVSLALALGHEPQLLLLDDPTLGLDVAMRRVLYEEIVGELADRGATILVASHDLAGIEGIADRVGFMKDGRLIAAAGLDELKQCHAGAPALEEIFLSITGDRTEVA